MGSQQCKTDMVAVFETLQHKCYVKEFKDLTYNMPMSCLDARNNADEELKKAMIDKLQEDDSMFLRRYNPFVVNTYYSNSTFYEIFASTAYEYGIDNVRGGKWKNITLTIDEKKDIQILIDIHRKACIRCHCVGHRIEECKTRPEDCVY